MQENFLHYLWRTRRFDMTDLKTTTNQSIEILNFGEYNTHAGPDFLNATIRIDDMTWAGNVEMHLKSSDWLLHNHQVDNAYHNVILHVVFEEDTPISIENRGENGIIPCLELKKRIPEGIYQTYWSLLHNEHWIPCQHHFFKVSDITKTMWYERLLVERLEQKTTTIADAFDRNNHDWEETFYQFVTRNFGVKVNTEPMEWLARSLPHIVLAKHKNNLLQIEALLYGQAGILEADFKDDYPRLLQKEYAFLRHKHQLTPINSAAWKFARMRPPSFPTIRLAQLAQLIHKSSHLFSKILDIETVKDIEALFDVGVSNYWQNQYTFDTPSVFAPKFLGKNTIHLIIVNTIAPFLFFYGTVRKEEQYRDRALRFLEMVNAESNSIIDGWKALGVTPKTAFDTQALLQLKNEYCTKKRCVECAIGGAIMR
jgi:hypothetical protein